MALLRSFSAVFAASAAYASFPHAPNTWGGKMNIPAPPPSSANPLFPHSFSSSSSHNKVGGPNNAATPLTNAVPYFDYAASNTFQYYRALVNMSSISAFTILVTPSAGNPDVYAFVGTIGGSSVLPRPPSTVYSYTSTSLTGIDAIRILPTDASVTSKTGCLGSVTGCPIWIAVSAANFKPCNYSIVVNDGTTETVLIPESPTFGTLYANNSVPAIQYYSMTVPSVSVGQVTFTLNPIGTFFRTQSPTLYISSSTFGTKYPDPTNSSTYCKMATVGSSGRAFALIPSTQIFCFSNLYPYSSSGTYYVAVVPSASQTTGNQQYVLIGSTRLNPPQELIDGVALGNDGSQFQLDQYFFNAFFDGTYARALRITNTPIIGSVQLYATVDGSVPTDSNYQYSSQRYSGENEIAIRYYDPAVIQGPCGIAIASNTSCVVNIAAYTSTVRSSYQVTARMNAAYTLVNGISVTDYLGTGDSSLYTFTITRPNSTTSFRLAEEQGALFMLLGSDQVNGTSNPTVNDPTTYFLSSQGSRYPTQQSLVSAVGTYGFCGIPPCVYYLAVTTAGNWTGGEYTISATQDGNGVGILILNTPTVDGLEQSPALPTPLLYNTYVMAYPEASRGGSPSSSLSFSLDVTPGSQPTIAASIFVLGVTNTSLLSPYSPQYSSRVSAGDTSALFTIYATDSIFNTSCLAIVNAASTVAYNASCGVLVWVLADRNVQSQYSILPFAGSRQLFEGQAVVGYSNTNAYSYYRFTIGSFSNPVTISVTPILGDPELFIGIGFYPSLGNATLSSMTNGGEVLTITWDSPLIMNAIAKYNLTRPFDIAIAVLGYAGPATYSIQASTSIIPYLNDGIPITGQVSAGVLSYWYFYVPPGNSTSAQGMRFTWAVQQGSQLIVLINNIVPINASYPLLPRCNGACFNGVSNPPYANSPIQSLTTGAYPGEIDIDPTDPRYIAGVNYIVGILAPTDTKFTLTASYVRAVQTLVSYVPISQTLLGCSYAWYKLSLNIDFQQIMFIVTPKSSDNSKLYPVLYTSIVTRRPSAFNNTLFSNSSVIAGRPSIVTYTPASLTNNFTQAPCFSRAAPGCTIYAAVYMQNRSATACASSPPPFPFSIEARIMTTNITYTVLPNGDPIFGTILPGGVSYYVAPLSLPTTTTPVSISLSPTAGNVNLYVTLDGSDPSPSNCPFYSNTSSGVDYIYIPSTSTGYATNMTVKIAVYAAPVQSPPGPIPPPRPTPSSFYIWYSVGSSTITQMIAGVSVSGTVGGGQFDYYFFQATTSDDLIFTVTPTDITGDPDLFVANFANVQNNTNFRPGPGMNCANSTRDGGDFIIVPGFGPSTGFGPIPTTGNYAVNCRVPGVQGFIVGVSCDGPSTSLCAYGLVATLGEVTPVALQEGRSVGIRVLPNSYAYVAIDISDSLLNGRNFSLSATSTSGTSAIYATNQFQPGITPPTSLPTSIGNALWQYPPANENRTAFSIINIFTTDSVFNACPLGQPQCNTLVAGIYSDVGSNVNVLAYSTGGGPIQLTLGVPSSPSGLNAQGSRTFVVQVSDITKDLVIYYDIFSGSLNSVYVSIDPTNDQTNCQQMPMPPPSGSIRCNGVWAIGQGGRTITIASANPCSNAQQPPIGPPGPPGPPPSAAAAATDDIDQPRPPRPTPPGICNNATDGTGSFRPGPLYITVFASNPVVFSLVVATKSTPVPLLDSVPSTRTTSYNDPALYEYMPAPVYTTTAPSIRFLMATSSAQGVSFFVKSCIDGQCKDSDRVVTNASFSYTFTVAGNSAGVSLLNNTLSSLIFCPAPQGGFCHYFIAVYPSDPVGCPGKCAAPFTLIATQVTGTVPLLIPADLISGTVINFPDLIVPFGGSQPFEFYLDPSNGPWDLRVGLDACGPGFVAMYGCNPDNTKCKNVYQPNAQNFDYSARTAGAPSSYMSGGNAAFTFLGVQSGAAFATLFDDNSTNLALSSSVDTKKRELVGASGPGQGFIMTVGASSKNMPAYFFSPGVNANGDKGFISKVKQADPNSTEVELTWPAAVITDARGGYVATPSNVLYLIYVAQGGFNATPGVISGSSCGLKQWSLFNPRFIVPTNVNNVSITNLVGGGYYEVNLVASCGPACWSSINVTSSVANAGRVLRVTYNDDGSNTLGISQSQVQTIPYMATNFTSSGSFPSGGGGNADNAGTSIVAIAGGAGGGAFVLLLICVGACMCRRRRGGGVPSALPTDKSSMDARAARAAQLGLGASSGSLSAPDAANTAMAVELQASREPRATFEPAATGSAAPSWK